MLRFFSLMVMTFAFNLWLTTPTSTAIAQGNITETTEETTEPIVRERHIIRVTVTAPEEIKVEEGDEIQVGQVIAERTEERERLQAKRDELALAIAKLQEPMVKPAAPPTPTFAPEETAVDSARSALAYWESIPLPDFRFVKEEMIMVHDKEILQERQDVALKRLEAQRELNTAIANLQAARNQYEYTLYQYQINLLEIEQRQRERTLEAMKLGSRLDEIDKQLETLSAIKSPYAGKVRKVQILNQSDLQINAEITLLIPESNILVNP